MKEPLVSIIIPTYNRAGIIAKTVGNVFEQTYPNIELIVVDDGSTDGTKEVLASFGERIRRVSQPNAGPSAARNRGLEMAKGEIVAFQDSDDLWHPTKIERQVSLLERAGESVPCCLCNVGFRAKQAEGETSFENAPIAPRLEEGLWTNVAEVLTTRFILFNQAAAIRRSVLEKVGGFDESLKYLEDYELPLRIALEGPWAFIRTPLVYYGPDSENSWSKRAYREPVLLNECHVLLRENILRRVNKRRDRPTLADLMERYLRRANRDLKLTRMIHGSSRLCRVLGLAGQRAERMRTALDRRLPGYPKMKVQRLPSDSSHLADDSSFSTAHQVGVPRFQQP